MADQASGLLSAWLRARRIAAVLPFLRGQVLDYGCGVGVLAGRIEARRYTGYDPDADSIAIAQKQNPRHTFDTHLDLAKRFDTVVALAVLEHLKDPVTDLRKWAELLSEDGQLVLTTPHPAYDWIHTVGAKIGLFSRHASEEHEHLWDEEGLHDLARQSELKIIQYQRFLVGANQLVVWSKRRSKG